MRFASIRALALASLASLAMATPGSAITILQFAQTSPTDGNVVATVAAATTTLSTTSAAAPGSIPVNITTIGGVQLAPIVGPGGFIAAFETFTTVVSTGAATTSGNTINQPFRGTISFTAGPNGTGFNYLTATFIGGSLSGLTGGGSAGLVASDPPLGNVVYTSQDPRVLLALAQLGPAALDNFSLSFSGIVQPPGFSINGTTVAAFTARNTGTFDTNPVPEPSGLVMAGTAMLASFGFFGWRRRQSAQA
jgi:hypothetical protein